jgi:toxin FitB
VIILDTNVLSEILRAKPAPAVREWVAAQPSSTLFTTTITQGVLGFDRPAARAFADIAAARRRAGRPIAQLDTHVAGIARSRGSALATRNSNDFEDCGIELLDPWS